MAYNAMLIRIQARAPSHTWHYGYQKKFVVLDSLYGEVLRWGPDDATGPYLPSLSKGAALCL